MPGQGKSEAGDPVKFSLSQFAADILDFADQRRVDRFVIGGISMGAALSLRIAVRFPERVKALILSRPRGVGQGAAQHAGVRRTGGASGQRNARQLRQTETPSALLERHPTILSPCENSSTGPILR